MTKRIPFLIQKNMGTVLPAACLPDRQGRHGVCPLIILAVVILGLSFAAFDAQAQTSNPFNQAPEIQVEEQSEAQINQFLEVGVHTTDENGDPVSLSCTLENLEPLAAIGANFLDFGDGNGSFQWIAPTQFSGQDVILKITARDSQGLSTGKFITIHVAQFIDPAKVEGAKLIQPATGSTISDPQFYFEWSSGRGAQEYWLEVGHKPGANDIFSKNTGLTQSAFVYPIPVDGQYIYARLWIKINDQWYYEDYSFPTASKSEYYLKITQPANGTTITTWPVQFTWEDNCLPGTNYTLTIGTGWRKQDIEIKTIRGSKSAVVSSIPLMGDDIFVTLAADATCQNARQDFIFQTSNDSQWMKNHAKAATMITPENSSTVNVSSLYFRWNDILGATEYKLFIGTELGVSDIYKTNLYKSNNVEINDLEPKKILQGREKIFVRLWTHIYQQWLYQDYQYSIGEPPDVLAQLISPSAGSTITDDNINFIWSPGLNIKKYRLEVGTRPDATDIFKKTLIDTQQSVAIQSPYPGSIYVRLWSFLNDDWVMEDDYRFEVNIPKGDPPRLLNPSESAKISPQMVLFQWENKKGFETYSLKVGSQPGLSDIFEANDLKETRVVVPDIGAGIKQIFVVLGSQKEGLWFYQEYVFFVEETVETTTRLISPPPGTTLSDETQTVLEWSAVTGITEYRIEIGTKPGLKDIHEATLLNQNYFILPALPLPENSTARLYVRLWFHKDQQWQHRDYEYLYKTHAKKTAPAPAANQLDGIFLINSKLWFRWQTTEDASGYRVQVGTQMGKGDLFDEDVGKTNVLEINDFKIKSQKIYIRVWTKTAEKWSFADHEFSLR